MTCPHPYVGNARQIRARESSNERSWQTELSRGNSDTNANAAPSLGKLLVDRILEIAGSASAIEAFGKAAAVGTAGELEHAAALIHTVRFGDVYRSAVGGASVLSFSNLRVGPNGSITIPMVHKIDDSLRSHFHTLQFSIGDAPAPDELVVVLGAATGGRPHHRIGTRADERAAMAGG
jgi:Amino acid synthesis